MSEDEGTPGPVGESAKGRGERKKPCGGAVQAGVAVADKAQLCPWKAQGTAKGEGRAPSHQVMWDERGGDLRQTLWELWDPLFQT